MYSSLGSWSICLFLVAEVCQFVRRGKVTVDGHANRHWGLLTTTCTAFTLVRVCLAEACLAQPIAAAMLAVTLCSDKEQTLPKLQMSCGTNTYGLDMTKNTLAPMWVGRASRGSISRGSVFEGGGSRAVASLTRQHVSQDSDCALFKPFFDSGSLNIHPWPPLSTSLTYLLSTLGGIMSTSERKRSPPASPSRGDNSDLPKRRVKHKRGKRIAQLLDQQQDGIEQQRLQRKQLHQGEQTHRHPNTRQPSAPRPTALHSSASFPAPVRQTFLV